MFFTLSKLLFFFITPFFWCAALLIIGIIRRKRTNRWFWYAGMVFLIFSNPFLYRKAMLAYQEKPITRSIAASPITTGILLTGFVGFDTAGNGYFGKSSDRFIQAANLYHTGKVKQLIISGGSGNFWIAEPPEAIFVKKQLINNGIPDSCIFIEKKSRNTYENGLYTKQLIDSARIAGPFFLITSALHMPRSIKIFKKLNISCIPYPCDYKVYPETNHFMNTVYPDVSLMKDWEYLIKEILGTLAYRITGKA
jgi:uncharacterized SAM-binding protein YcdF (DUF218 family)